MSEAPTPEIELKKRKGIRLGSLDYELVRGPYGNAAKIILRPDLWFKLIDLETRHAHQWESAIEGVVRDLKAMSMPELTLEGEQPSGTGRLDETALEEFKQWVSSNSQRLALLGGTGDSANTLLKLYAVGALTEENLKVMDFENHRMLSFQLNQIAENLASTAYQDRLKNVNRFIERSIKGSAIKRGLIAGLGIAGAPAAIGIGADLWGVPLAIAAGEFLTTEGLVGGLGRLLVREKKQLQITPGTTAPSPAPPPAAPPPSEEEGTPPSATQAEPAEEPPEWSATDQVVEARAEAIKGIPEWFLVYARSSEASYPSPQGIHFSNTREYANSAEDNRSFNHKQLENAAIANTLRSLGIETANNIVTVDDALSGQELVVLRYQLVYLKFHVDGNRSMQDIITSPDGVDNITQEAYREAVTAITNYFDHINYRVSDPTTTAEKFIQLYLNIETVQTAEPVASVEKPLPQQVAEARERLDQIVIQLGKRKAEALSWFHKDQECWIWWREYNVGPRVLKGDEDLWRGYAQVDPSDMGRSIEIITDIVTARYPRRKGTSFKIALAALPSEPEPQQGNQLGQYAFYEDQANDDEPRIVFYADKKEELLEVLSELSEDPRWEAIEQKRTTSPRREWSSSFIDDNEREWRSLNYLRGAGHAIDYSCPGWRGEAEGTHTMLLDSETASQLTQLPSLPNLAENYETPKTSRIILLNELIKFLQTHYGVVQLPSLTITRIESSDFRKTASRNNVPANQLLCVDREKEEWVFNTQLTTETILSNTERVAYELMAVMQQKDPNLPAPDKVVFQEKVAVEATPAPTAEKKKFPPLPRLEPPKTGAFKEMKANLETLAKYVETISGQIVPRFGSWGGLRPEEFKQLRQELNLPSDTLIAWLPPGHRGNPFTEKGYWISGGTSVSNKLLTTDPRMPFIIVRDMMAAAYSQNPFLVPPMPLAGKGAVLNDEKIGELFEGALKVT